MAYKGTERRVEARMQLPATTWVRPVLAGFCVLTLCAAVLLNDNIPSWFIVITSTIIAFYFGHVNGTAEKTTTQAGEIATTAMRNVVNSLITSSNNQQDNNIRQTSTKGVV